MMWTQFTSAARTLDTRTGDRHKPRIDTRKGDRHAPVIREIVGIDGEGHSDNQGRHFYTLIAASTGESLAGDDLGFFDCIDFLLGIGRPDTLYVIFSGNYDVSMILHPRDLTYLQLLRLFETNHLRVGPYDIKYIPGKEFWIKDRITKKSIQIWDVFGFFQKSFVKSLEDWKIGSEQQVALIRAMKERRSEFLRVSPEKILEYCLLECRLLVQLIEKLRDSFDYLDLKLSRWDGAGAVAAAIFRQRDVKQYNAPLPLEYKEPILSAYFGGRFELLYSGQHNHLYSYDINSAYPYITSKLPCMLHLQWWHSKKAGAARGTKYGLYHVRWSIDPSHPWPPFPFRYEGQIIYPYRGEGWYHMDEVHAAIRLHPDGIKVVDFIGFKPECKHKPFDFIPELYAYRKQLKADDNDAQLSLKLGLNSLYGKTAQGVGYGDKKPPYQNFIWAGLITSGCRAMILRAIAQNPEAVISVATDGIMSREKLDLPLGNNLGDWEYSEYDSGFSVQPGIYLLRRGDREITKTRGFGAREVNWNEIRRSYAADPLFGQYEYECERFFGLGSSLNSGDFEAQYRTWKTVQRVINFCPSRRFPAVPFSRETAQQYIDGDSDTKQRVLAEFGFTNHVRLCAPDRPDEQPISRPYEPKSSWIDAWSPWRSDSQYVDSEQP